MVDARELTVELPPEERPSEAPAWFGGRLSGTSDSPNTILRRATTMAKIHRAFSNKVLRRSPSRPYSASRIGIRSPIKLFRGSPASGSAGQIPPSSSSPTTVSASSTVDSTVVSTTTDTTARAGGTSRAEADDDSDGEGAPGGAERPSLALMRI